MRHRKSSTPAAPPVTSLHYRADIDGLRALAIGLVVAYHVWFGRVSGGVDVFLMISAFLLTASLVRRAQRDDGDLGLGRFWLHRFSRLLPAAAVTVTGVLATMYLTLPEGRWPELWREAWSSLLYVQNWTLANADADYYARDWDTASPFQHFWSLAIQGQVFILWPIVIALTVWAVRRRRRLLIPALIAVFATIFVVSLVFSVVETQASQASAYFDTRTRLWEFAAGSLVALLLPFVRLAGPVRAVLGWVGVIGIVLCGMVFDVEGGFPGYLALWPVVCTALVIVSGHGPARGGVGLLLASRPLLALGRHAYALYLVHWPVLVTWMAVRERSSIGPVGGVAIIVISLALARLLTRDLELPLRRFTAGRRETWRAGAVLAASVMLVAGPLAAWQSQQSTTTAAIDYTDARQYPGAALIDSPDNLAGPDAQMIPLPTRFDEEWTSGGMPCEDRWIPDDPRLALPNCHHPPSGSADRSVLVVGDSHAQQLAAPLLTLAKERSWSVVLLLHGGCPLGYGELSVSAEEPVACEDWRYAATAYARATRPDAVYLVTTKATAQAPERLMTGVADVIRELVDDSIDVIGVRDNPRFSFNMYECVLEGARDCAVPLEHVLSPENPSLALDDRVLQVDFSPWLCPGGLCHGVIGNIAVYLDDNHLTGAYGRTLAPVLTQMIDEQRDRLPSLAAGT